MTNLIKIKKGLDIRLFGDVKNDNIRNQNIGLRNFAIYPDDYHGLCPKLLKKEGEAIKSGEAIVHDKNDSQIAVASPVSGTIKKIVRGERRKIERIEISASDSNESRQTFDITVSDADSIKSLLKESGIWVQMRQRPYDVIPDPTKEPRDIFITTFDSSPLATPSSFLKEDANLFNKGVEILSKLTKGKVFIGCRKDNCIETKFSTTYIIKGPHPAGNAGIQIANIKPVNKGETVWTLDAETVIRIGHLFTKGFVDYTTIVSLTGECVDNPERIRTIAGASLSELLQNKLNCDNESCRIISGNVLTGIHESIDGYLHFPFRQITVIPENAHKAEFMGWASVNPGKYSFSRCFLSWLGGKEKRYHFDAKVNGGERAIIMAGEYDKVLPMDIYSEFLIKAILAKDIDKMELLGAYEIAPEDFALCEFIDTSKLELQKIVREGLDYMRKEMN